MNNFKAGDRVLIPRTSGDKTLGEIIFISGEIAVVSFTCGETFRGEPVPVEYSMKLGMKKVAIKDLVKEEDI